MIYECEHCETVLKAGMTACPRCAQAFDEPVPPDATPANPKGVAIAAPALPKTRAKRPVRLPSMALWLIACLVLISLGWLLGTRYNALPHLAPPAPAGSEAAEPANMLPTDLAAHVGYKKDMAGFVAKLRTTGVGAQWPAFGSNDTLLITPQAMVNGQRAAYNPDLYRELAQGVYANFVFRRYDSGFSDTDSTTCFVIVTNTSGQVVAADLMGNLQ